MTARSCRECVKLGIVITRIKADIGATRFKLIRAQEYDNQDAERYAADINQLKDRLTDAEAALEAHEETCAVIVTTLTSAVDTPAPAICGSCGEPKPLIARGRCNRCYQRAHRAGQISDFAGEQLPTAGFSFAPQPWADDALCAQTDPESFFPDKGGSTREAKSICARCDVRTECLTYALDHQERFGIWGGLSDRERRKLRRTRTASTPAPVEPEQAAS